MSSDPVSPPASELLTEGEGILASFPAVQLITGSTVEGVGTLLVTSKYTF